MERSKALAVEAWGLQTSPWPSVYEVRRRGFASSSDLPNLLKSCGLDEYSADLQKHNVQELQSLLKDDKDALYDILIDARMKTGDRRAFVRALEQHHPNLTDLLRSCGLEQYVLELESHEVQELQSLLVRDKDALFDILIDAGMKTADRKVFLKALEHTESRRPPASTASSAASHEDMPSSRTTVSYLLSPSFFAGQWSLERDIWQTASGAGRVGSCYGVANFMQEGLETEVSTGLGVKRWLRYKESGEQLFPSDSATDESQQQKIAFTMTYLYQHSLLQDRLDIFFDRQRGGGPDDEDIFCSFNLTRADFNVPLKSTSHYCRGDLYEGEFILRDANSWRLRYSINGPTKACIIETRYKRLERVEK